MLLAVAAWFPIAAAVSWVVARSTEIGRFLQRRELYRAAPVVCLIVGAAFVVIARAKMRSRRKRNAEEVRRRAREIEAAAAHARARERLSPRRDGRLI